MTRVSTVERKSNIITTERQDRYGVTALILDIDKCTGCNLCWTVCPRYAIERGPIGASKRHRTTAPPIRVNYHKCVYCGLCAYICPFDALKLTINGKPAEKIRRGVSLPFLKGHKIKSEKTGTLALKFINGTITIDDNECPGGCSTCIDVCPTEVLYLPVATKEKPWETTPKVGVDRDRCLYCGACLFACPAKSAVNLTRTEILHSEEGSDSRVWQNIERKLLAPIESRYWFYEKREKTAPSGDQKLAPKRRKLKE